MLRKFLKFFRSLKKKSWSLKKNNFGGTRDPWGGVWDKQLYPWPGFLIFLRSYVLSNNYIELNVTGSLKYAYF